MLLERQIQHYNEYHWGWGDVVRKDSFCNLLSLSSVTGFCPLALSPTLLDSATTFQSFNIIIIYILKAGKTLTFFPSKTNKEYNLFTYLLKFKDF